MLNINTFQSFGWQTFKRVGASLTISRVYKIVLTLSIVIQISLFFIVTSIALWLDQLWNGAIGHLEPSPVFRPLLIMTLIVSIEGIFVGRCLTHTSAAATPMACLCERAKPLNYTSC